MVYKFENAAYEAGRDLQNRVEEKIIDFVAEKNFAALRHLIAKEAAALRALDEFERRAVQVINL